MKRTLVVLFALAAPLFVVGAVKQPEPVVLVVEDGHAYSYYPQFMTGYASREDCERRKREVHSEHALMGASVEYIGCHYMSPKRYTSIAALGRGIWASTASTGRVAEARRYAAS